ncbi:MAG: hypothetical protein AAGD07_11700 [Planctomycetota bacterium]
MSGSDVRSIESLGDLHRATVHLADRLAQEGQQIRAAIHRAENRYSQDYPAYWRSQTRLAERRLTEAQDALSRKRATVRAGDRPPATEEAKRVAVCKARLDLCHKKYALTRRVSVEMEQACEKLQGPLADLVELADVTLPGAATRLATLIQRLRAYQDQSKPPTESNPGGE